MKTKITLSILSIIVVVTYSIYFFRNYDYRISHLINYVQLGSLLVVNICFIIVIGYYLKQTVNNYFKI